MFLIHHGFHIYINWGLPGLSWMKQNHIISNIGALGNWYPGVPIRHYYVLGRNQKAHGCATEWNDVVFPTPIWCISAISPRSSIYLICISFLYLPYLRLALSWFIGGCNWAWAVYPSNFFSVSQSYCGRLSPYSMVKGLSPDQPNHYLKYKVRLHKRHKKIHVY